MVKPMCSPALKGPASAVLVIGSAGQLTVGGFMVDRAQRPLLMVRYAVLLIQPQLAEVVGEVNVMVTS